MRAYLETALWSSTDGVDTDAALAARFDSEDPETFEPDALERCKADCRAFLEKAETLIESDTPRHSPEWTRYELAGHDFWLNRNGHGAGFWDGDWPVNGDALSEIAKTFGEIDFVETAEGKLTF